MIVTFNDEYYWWSPNPQKVNTNNYVCIIKHPIDERVFMRTIIEINDNTGDAKIWTDPVPRDLVLAWLDRDTFEHRPLTRKEFELLIATHNPKLSPIIP